MRKLVVDYLSNEGHDLSLAQQLFTGMVERVVALVSRVEGTYEFEVQPLREYFAARHLYNTAPYSPPGSPQNGTLPERFDALSRDFYWQNVTRFYAGCYNKGELPSLVDRLEDLSRAAGYKFTRHPQTLAATLLADWVFAQHPKSMKQVIALILDGITLRYITSGSRVQRRHEPLILPKQCGNEELLERCFELLGQNQANDYATTLIELIRFNAGRMTLMERWMNAIGPARGTQKTTWLRYGLQLGVLSSLGASELEALLKDDPENPEWLSLCLRGGQRSFIERNERRLAVVVDYVLDRNPEGGFRRSAPSLVEKLGQAINPPRYTFAFRDRHPIALRAVWDHIYTPPEPPASPEEEVPSGDLAFKCKEIVELASKLSDRAASDWATELGPWNQLVERARELFGDRWAFRILANTSAGIRSKDETCDDATELHDPSVPLCRRVRYARLRAGVATWWESQLEAATEQQDVAFALLILFTWAGQTVLTKHAQLIDRKLLSLKSGWWHKLNEAIQSSGFSYDSEKREIEIKPATLPSALSPRTIVALCSRMSDRGSDLMFREFLAEYEGNDPAILEFCQRSAVRATLEAPSTWQKWLPIVSRSYAKGVVSDRYWGHKLVRAISNEPLPREAAEKIIQNSNSYPAELVVWAERVCHEYVAEEVFPVGKVADKQNWFRL